VRETACAGSRIATATPLASTRVAISRSRELCRRSVVGGPWWFAYNAIDQCQFTKVACIPQLPVDRRWRRETPITWFPAASNCSAERASTPCRGAYKCRDRRAAVKARNTASSAPEAQSAWLFLSIAVGADSRLSPHRQARVKPRSTSGMASRFGRPCTCSLLSHSSDGLPNSMPGL
jgi:hypothetical protein